MAQAYLRPERRTARPSPWLVGLALSVVAGVVFVTLCPIGLRPRLASPDVERFGAFLVLGVLVSRASGRRALGATAVLVLLALGLEAAQALAPGRDARLADAVVKAFGGVVGVSAAQLAFPARRWLARRLRTDQDRRLVSPAGG